MLAPITTSIDTETLRKLEEFSKPVRRNVNDMTKDELIAFYHAQLCLISQITIDDDVEEYPNEMTGEKEYVWLSVKAARENLQEAVELARYATMQWVMP